ncbi:MAG: hypothetical protein KatS3mg076_2426 [Candidatus Binatia bacterium]|nr:MAG: hypothetical protein KatS3mg076_2426 [Candidatus Binatia bacterium]
MEKNMGEFIRKLRARLGLTQEELAHQLGITVGTVNRWENGRFRPSKLGRSTLREFALRHGIPFEDEAELPSELPSPERPEEWKIGSQ